MSEERTNPNFNLESCLRNKVNEAKRYLEDKHKRQKDEPCEESSYAESFIYYFQNVETLLDLYNKEKEENKELSEELTERICKNVEAEVFEEMRLELKQEKEKNKELETQRQNGTLSDGFHTFNDLYYQRCVLFATICNLNKNIAWKSKKHNDGKKCFDSDQWFIVGIDTPEGTYTYHYEITYWDLFTIQELEKGKEWDGHTEKDVTRLLSLINNNISKGKIKEKIEYYKRLLNEDNWGEKTELGFKNRAVALQELLEEE